MSSANPRARQHVLGIVALSLFAALFTRLWYLQVLETEEATRTVADANIEVVIEEAPRGRILDRSGKVLVENTDTIQVAVDYQDFDALETPEQNALTRRLAQFLNEDAVLIAAGQRVPDDPGPRPDTEDGATTTSSVPGEDEEGDESTTTTSTTTTVVDDPDDPDDNSALDTADPDAIPAGPYEQRPPPFGVATGADNPDGVTDAEADAPDPLTPDDVAERIEDPRYSKFKPIPVATGVSEDLEIYITEHPDQFPTVTVSRTTVRKYNYGALLAHVLGYIGTISEDELDRYQNDEKPYENDDDIGKAGIEQAMERELRGTPGRRVYEVDARNRVVRELEDQREAPVAGRDVYLTIDINMQYIMEKGLAAEVKRRTGVFDGGGCFVEPGCEPKGAASVSIDPRNGQVLAMASFPTYDPNLFVGGISTEDYEAISDEERKDEHNDPLLNRAITGRYAPGSTFKLFSSYAGLDTGLITPNQFYDDTGIYKYAADCPVENPENNCSATNAGRTPHGSVNLEDALRVSSDTYYYWIGDRSWRQRDSIGGEEAMQDSMKKWGLDEPTGIDLPGDAGSRIPTPTWLREFSLELNGDTPLGREAGTWTPGVSGNTMVGQGDVVISPLQLAQGYATLANGGTIWKPQLVLQVTDYSAATNVEVMEPVANGQVELPPEWRDPMIRGFDGVTKGPGGTATRAFSGFDQSTCPVAGKTGTAQVNDKNDSSLFAAFAPTPTPERPSVIAMATVFQEAGFGADAAVPLTRRVLEPFSDMGCDITAFGGKDSPYAAPPGGWFDVDEAIQTFVPTQGDTQD